MVAFVFGKLPSGAGTQPEPFLHVGTPEFCFSTDQHALGGQAFVDPAMERRGMDVEPIAEFLQSQEFLQVFDIVFSFGNDFAHGDLEQDSREPIRTQCEPEQQITPDELQKVSG